MYGPMKVAIGGQLKVAFRRGVEGLENSPAEGAAILARKPARLFLTHYGYSEDPKMDLAGFRERLRRWAALADELLRKSPDEKTAQDEFVGKCREEMNNAIGVIEAEHHAFTGGLDLSFLGLARYIKKKAKAAEAK